MPNTIKKGSSDISKFYKGSTEVDKIYKGSVEVYSSAPPKLIYIFNDTIDLTTPISINIEFDSDAGANAYSTSTFIRYTKIDTKADGLYFENANTSRKVYDLTNGWILPFWKFIKFVAAPTAIQNWLNSNTITYVELYKVNQNAPLPSGGGRVYFNGSANNIYTGGYSAKGLYLADPIESYLSTTGSVNIKSSSSYFTYENYSYWAFTVPMLSIPLSVGTTGVRDAWFNANVTKIFG